MWMSFFQVELARAWDISRNQPLWVSWVLLLAARNVDMGDIGIGLCYPNPRYWFFRWPRMLIQVYAKDSNGKKVMRGYGTALIPTFAGRRTSYVHLFKPKSSTILQVCVAWEKVRYVLGLLVDCWQLLLLISTGTNRSTQWYSARVQKAREHCRSVWLSMHVYCVITCKIRTLIFLLR